VWHARHSGYPPLAVKWPQSREATLKEWRVLTELASAGMPVAAPRFLADTEAFFAIDWIEGHAVTQLLKTPARHKHLEAIGAWIARLHRINRTSIKHWDAFRWFDRLQKEWATMRDDPVCIAAQERFRMLVHRTGSLDVTHAITHGDFQQYNILTTDAGPVGFDMFRYGQKNFAMFDLANFLVSIQAKYVDKTSQFSAVAEQDTKALLAGYGPLAPGDRALLDVLMARVVVNRLHRWPQIERITKGRRTRGMLVLDASAGFTGSAGRVPPTQTPPAIAHPRTGPTGVAGRNKHQTMCEIVPN